MTEHDPRPEPSCLRDEDLIAELGIAVGSLTALEMMLSRGTVKPHSKADVEEGCRQWSRRVSRLEREFDRRGISIVVVDDWMRPDIRQAERG